MAVWLGGAGVGVLQRCGLGLRWLAGVLYLVGTTLSNRAAPWVSESGERAIRFGSDGRSPADIQLLVLVSTVALATAAVLVAAALSRRAPRVEPVGRVAPPPYGAWIGDGGATGDEESLCAHNGDVPSKGASMECVAPATGQLLGYVTAMDVKEVHHRVRAARDAQRQWQLTTFDERRRVFRLLRNYILEFQDDLVRAACEDSGKTRVDAHFGEITITLEKIRWMLTSGEAALRPSRRASPLVMMHRAGQVEYHPLGVVAAFAPWNYAFHNLLNTVLAALFAGSAAVVKASEYTGWSSVYYAQVLRAVLRAAGHSAALVQVITGDSDAGEALVNADVDRLYFTGSTAVGRKVARRAAERLLPTVLELGGKDAAVVCEDADLSAAVPVLLRGLFQNSGQNCVGIERVLVHQRKYAELVRALEREIGALRQGDDLADGVDGDGGVDVGAMTMRERGVFNVQALVNDAVQHGARLLGGGERWKRDGGGVFYRPTLLVDVTAEMRVAREETFGPVAAVMCFDDDAHALAIVNGVEYGLNCYVFTPSRARGDLYVAGARCGMVQVGDFATNYMNQALPFGGTKASGTGHFAGVEGLRGCCLSKTVTRPRRGFLPAPVPRALRYPLPSNADSFCKELNHLMYSDERVLGKCGHVRNLAAICCSERFRPAVPRQR